MTRQFSTIALLSLIALGACTKSQDTSTNHTADSTATSGDTSPNATPSIEPSPTMTGGAASLPSEPEKNSMGGQAGEGDTRESLNSRNASR